MSGSTGSFDGIYEEFAPGDPGSGAQLSDQKLITTVELNAETEDLDAMLQQLPQTLAAITKDLHSGTSAIKPLCEGKQDACRYCDFRAVCRYKEESKKEEST